MKKPLLLLTLALLTTLPIAAASTYWHDDTTRQYRYDQHRHHVRPIILTNYGYHANAWRYHSSTRAYDHPRRYSQTKRFYHPSQTHYRRSYRYGGHHYNRGHVNVYYR